MNWIMLNKAAIIAGTLLVLKWIYNAWTPDVTFAQFVRTFIGEIIQEAPKQLPSMTLEQQKLLVNAGHPLLPTKKADADEKAEPKA